MSGGPGQRVVLDSGGTACPALTPHLQGALQVGLNPLPIVLHRTPRAQLWARMGTLGCTPIQVGPPAARLRYLQEETVGAQAKAGGQAEVSPAPSPAHQSTRRSPGPPATCPVLPQVLRPSQAWPYRRQSRKAGVSGPGYLLLRCRRKRRHGAAGLDAARPTQGLLQGAVLSVERWGGVRGEG